METITEQAKKPPLNGEKKEITEGVPLGLIYYDPNQPRKTFDRDGLNELKASIFEHGILQAIGLRRVVDGYQIIFGERRFRAMEELAKEHPDMPQFQKIKALQDKKKEMKKAEKKKLAALPAPE